MEGQLADTKVTEQTLKADVETSLEDYYKRRKTLTEYITVAREALETSQKELKELEKKYASKRKMLGLHKTKARALWDFIKENPGLRHLVLIKKFIEEVYPEQTYQAIQGFASELQYKGNLDIRDGLYYATETYTMPSDKYGYGYMAGHIRTVLIEGKSLTQPEIETALIGRGIEINRKSVRGVLNNFVEKDHVSTNQTYRNQRNIVYTWIGETNV